MSAPPTQRPAPPSREIKVGWGLSGLVGLFLISDAAMKLLRLPIVIETMAELGWPSSSVVPLGIILLISTLLYLFPATSVLGSILLTGYLGGAIATHVRIGSPLFTHTLFGVYVGALMWAGLYFRNPYLRAVLPLSRRGHAD
jgi:hypothetical protein